MKKKNKLRKWGKGILIFSSALFLGLITWANWNATTLTESLAKIEMSSFDLSNVSDQHTFDMIQDDLKRKKGVTACAVNPDSKMASVTFYPEQISKDELLTDIKVVSGSKVDYKHFEVKAGCPVKATSEFFGKLKASLRFRD